MNMSCRVEQFLEEGEAFYPAIEPGVGDGAGVCLKGEQLEIWPLTADQLLDKILDYFGTNLASNRKRYGQFLLGKKQLLPVPLTGSLTLIPYHSREKVGSQARTGWVVAHNVAGFRKIQNYVSEIVTTTHDVTVYHSRNFCFEQLKNARFVQHGYREIHNLDQTDKRWNFFKGDMSLI
ncbi:hypothetical protein [Salsuginibacillus kocurii]|uniref:hypothetical protein n=1 Tax=Salsuginibacillus kocurii TaxID=427078 RepID=UPI0003A67324|nr:hypothetical protein [Salsuginibacillus kocurii]